MLSRLATFTYLVDVKFFYRIVSCCSVLWFIYDNVDWHCNF